MSQTQIARVGVIVKPHQSDAVKTICDLVTWLDRHNISLISEDTTEHHCVEHDTGYSIQTASREEMAQQVDLIVVLGGDGTMISVARMIRERDIPVLGINFGSLGYLAEFRMEEMVPALELILKGDFRLDRRVMLDVELVRGDETVGTGRVLNDVVINKAALARIIEIEGHFDNHFVNSFRSDGLIVSTPTGSTAYNLSAGGPVVYPSMNAVIVTPICPFTLSNRPIVIPDDALIELCLKSDNQEVILTLDGQKGFSLKANDRVLIRKSKTTFNIVQPTNRNYFDLLRDKLRWGR